MLGRVTSPAKSLDSVQAFQLVAEALPEPLVLVTEEGVIMAANATAAHVLGREQAALPGMALRDLVADPPIRLEGFLGACARSLRMIPGTLTPRKLAPASLGCEGTALKPSAPDARAALLLRLERERTAAADFGPVRMQGEELARETAKRKRLEEELRETQSRLQAAKDELQRLSALDPLTGVSNRAFFDRRLSEEWLRAARSGDPLSLILIDLDGLKTLNERIGQPGGDRYLRQVASILRGAAGRAADVVARHGADEFAALLPETDLTGAVHLAEAMRAGVEALRRVAMASVTISAGVVCLHAAPKVPASRLVDAADRALYEAKRLGRNRVAAVRDDESAGDSLDKGKPAKS
jgi:diguanylate cyclase (GGDEF)-like protein